MTGRRRGAQFCKSNEGKECYGWEVSLESMCYPSVEAVASKIQRMLVRRRAAFSLVQPCVPRPTSAAWAQAEHRLRKVFLATDSPDPRIFEDVLRERHGLALVRAFPAPTERHVDEWSLLVDQAICAHPQAKAFLGNFPSTVSVAILQQRDVARPGGAREGRDEGAAGGLHSRGSFDFFGSSAEHRAFFRSAEPPLALNVGHSPVHEHTAAADAGAEEAGEGLQKKTKKKKKKKKK